MLNVQKLRVIPLGGLGEIGLNAMAIEYGDEILLIDCGVLFPDLHWIGLDLVLPDFSYLVENKEKIVGLVVTHGHEDHIGAIPFLLKRVKVPKIYASRFASRLIEDKCAEHGTKSELNTERVKAGDRVEVGCFDVEFIHVTHSTLESFALAIRTPSGMIVHSGDFKFDETPYDGPASDKKRLGELGKEKPLLLLSDSTNSERSGHSASERSIGQELDQLVRSAKGAVIVALFASNIHRVHQLIDIAESCGRKIFLSGRSMERYINIALEENFLPIDVSLLHPIEDIGSFNRNEVLVLSTGSQGESRSSLLRLAKNENRWLKITSDDVVILSSRNIPGNERAISFVINQLYRLGANVHYSDLNEVHVSGHAYRSEQEELIGLVKPRFFIPIHGEYRHLVLHSKTAVESQKVKDGVHILENGKIWEYDPETDEVNTSTVIATGRNWAFQDNIGHIDDVPIKDRRSGARAGVVVVTCSVIKRGTDLSRSPEVSIKGFLCSESKQEYLLEEITKECESAFQNWSATNPDGYTREQFVAAAARRVVRRVVDAKPLVVVNFLSTTG